MVIGLTKVTQHFHFNFKLKVSREKQPYLEESSNNFKSCYTCVITDAVCLRRSSSNQLMTRIMKHYFDFQTCSHRSHASKASRVLANYVATHRGLNLRCSHSTMRTFLTSQFEYWCSSQYDIHIQICVT